MAFNGLTLLITFVALVAIAGWVRSAARRSQLEHDLAIEKSRARHPSARTVRIVRTSPAVQHFTGSTPISSYRSPEHDRAMRGGAA